MVWPTLIFFNSITLLASPSEQIDLCLNYVQGGFCLLDRKACLLGTRGNEARNKDQECPRHGPFDVWKTQEGLVLVSDLGSPYEYIEDCYGLGVSLEEATKIAQDQAKRLQTKIVTTQRRCVKCGTRFWSRGSLAQRTCPSRAAGYFCVSCLERTPEVDLEQYWKEIAASQETSHVDLSEWCG